MEGYALVSSILTLEHQIDFFLAILCITLGLIFNLNMEGKDSEFY
jgi:hypothetical protein